MKQFNSMASFAAHLTTAAVAVQKAEHQLLDSVGKAVKKAAKAKIGEYQEQAGPFIAWPELSENTLHGGVAPNGHRYQGKIELGYATESDHNPLLRTGEMRDSIGHKVQGSEVTIGSDSDVAAWQELGTRYMPPRSFLGGAMAEELPRLIQILGAGTVAALVGKDVFQGKMEIK